MFLVFLTLVSFPTLISARIGHVKQSHCLDEIKSGTLSLGCPHNQLIKLGRVFYGYSWSNDCSFIDKDCTVDVPREDIICLTTTNCTVRVVEQPLILQDCWNLAATYVQAEYECIAEYSLQNVCQPQDTTLSYGFLSTPGYPHGFQPNLNCPCALFASPGHAIVLEVIDFRLPTCAEAGLILWLGQDFQTKCLTQDPLTVVSNVQQNVTLRFYTLSQIKHGGFLIKYSVLPVSNNATVRLQCYVAPAVSRSPQASTNFAMPNYSQQSMLPATNANSEMNIVIDQANNHGDGNNIGNSKERGGGDEEGPLSPLAATHSNDLIKRFPSGQDFVPPILGTLEEHKDIISLAGVNKQQQLQGLNQSMYKRYIFPNSNSLRRSNVTLIVICVVAVAIFLLIMINALIWFIFSLRPGQPKPTGSFQNLYPRQATLTSDNKTISSYPTPIRPRRAHSQLSTRLDESSTLGSNPLMHRDHRILPQDAASNRLKTLRSLLFRGHKTLGMDPMTMNSSSNPSRDIDSTISEYHMRSRSQSFVGAQPRKTPYEEQEDCVDFKSECSVFNLRPSTNLTTKAKSNHQPRQINSWDDI